jgi:hypothetical protein
MNHRSPAQRAHQPAPTAGAPPETGAHTSTKAKSTGKTPQAFIEDFNMEHSCSNVTVSLRAFSDAADSSATRNKLAHSANSPSCVYLG